MSATLSAIASASACVRLVAEPRPADTPKPCSRCIPGETCIRFEPSDSIEDEMVLDAPVPIETIAITEEMPMTIPKIVRPERTLFAERAAYVSWKISLSLIEVRYGYD